MTENQRFQLDFFSYKAETNETKRVIDFAHDDVKGVLFQTRFCQGLNVALDETNIGLLVAKLFGVMVHICPGHIKLEESTLLHLKLYQSYVRLWRDKCCPSKSRIGIVSAHIIVSLPSHEAIM